MTDAARHALLELAARAAQVPGALVDAARLATGQHPRDGWRKTHPPYLLYGTFASILLTVMAALVASIGRSLRAGNTGWKGRD